MSPLTVEEAQAPAFLAGISCGFRWHKAICARGDTNGWIMMELHDLRYSPYQRRKSSRKVKATAASNDDLKWSPEEDALLRDGVCQYGGKKWKLISGQIDGRCPQECSKRWNKLLNTSYAVKRPWGRDEDQQMMKLVAKYGASKWAVIASHLQGRNGKQCRERWHNQLNPTIKKTPWTEEEDEIILDMQAELGNSWAKITTLLPGRTDNAVKNHWHSSLKERAKREQRGANPSRGRVATSRVKSKTKKSRNTKSRREKVLEEEPVAELGACAAEATVPTAASSVTDFETKAESLSAPVIVKAELGSFSPDSVANVDSVLTYGNTSEASVQRAQAVIDNILDPMGMGSCDTSDYDTQYFSVRESAYDYSEATCYDDFACAANYEGSVDPTSPAQPPFGLDELLYDSLSGVCGDILEACGLMLSAPLGEVARVYHRSTVVTESGKWFTYSSPSTFTTGPTFVPTATYDAPSLSSIDEAEDMVFSEKEESFFDPVKLEAPPVGCNFTQSLSSYAAFSSQVIMDV